LVDTYAKQIQFTNTAVFQTTTFLQNRKYSNVGSNSMTDTLIIQKATEEIEAKAFGVTKQFLEIHEIVCDDSKPKVARVDIEKEDGTAIVYFPVKDEKFYLAVYHDTIPQVSVRHVGTVYYNSVYLGVSSKMFSFKELSEMTKLQAARGHSKGDKRGGTYWKYSKVCFEPNPEPDEFEDKLKKLLDVLENDNEGIKQLADKADAWIQVAQEFHIGNNMLGGSFIDKESIKRIANLNLSIDFDLYVGGHLYK
jgi:Domain of unknown function (DUF4279)